MMTENKLIRDETSGAVLSIENGSLAEYKMRRQKLKEKNDQIKSLELRLQNIEELLSRVGIS